MPARTIRALIIPAAQDRPGQVIDLGYTAAAFSDVIGGGLLDDLYYGNLDHHIGETGTASSPSRYCIYADADRVRQQLPANPRAEILAARLGCIGDLRTVPLTGDILVTGTTITGDDTDVPCEVLHAAWRSGSLQTRLVLSG